jgi:hypothetical protein
LVGDAEVKEKKYMVSCPYARHHIRGALLPGFSRASGLRDQLEIQRT